LILWKNLFRKAITILEQLDLALREPAGRRTS